MGIGQTMDGIRKLEDLPNVGRAMAGHLRALGIADPQALRAQDPWRIYQDLAGVMGAKHDPCVWYTLLAVQHFFRSGEAKPWWCFKSEARPELK